MTVREQLAAWGVGLEVHVVASAAPVVPLAERHTRARVALERSQAAERAGERDRGPR